DRDVESLQISYKKMFDTYCRIFDRCGLKYVIVEADPGIMGGDVSHEFMVLAESGEDMIVKCSGCLWASSLDKAECADKQTNKKNDKESLLPLKEIDTPNIKTIEKLSKLLNVESKGMLKTIIYRSEDGFVAALVRGDFQINELKLSRAIGSLHLKLATDKEIEDLTGAPLGFSGPVGLKNAKIIADFSVRDMRNFIAGANKTDRHLINVNITRDFSVDTFSDIRFITESDTCPKCKASITLKHAIEVGHVFKLGIKYSNRLGAVFLDADGKTKPMVMGCYGIGINRIIAAIIEQSNDKEGIVWPMSLAPVLVYTIVLDPKDKISMKFASGLDDRLRDNKLDSLLDDRQISAGIKFKDADLIGAPIRITVNKDALKKGRVEIKQRRERVSKIVSKDRIFSLILKSCTST
ncbi:MAG: proline--tRNA ligase, partial [Candidatus Omnitrophica bacterium]|nr:proline--tRNA ligase [Candidatus Omnitrophota bacterium]